MFSKTRISSNRYSLSVVALYLSVIAICLYTHYDMVVFRVTVTQKVFAAAVSCIIVYLAIISLVVAGRRKVHYFYCVFFLLFALMGFGTASVTSRNLIWMFADASNWVLICAFFILATGSMENKQVRNLLILVAVLTWICSFAAFLYGERVNGRFEAPVIFAIVGMPLLLLHIRNHILLLGGISAHFIVGLLCFLSGERTTLVIWLFFSLCSLFIWLLKTSRKSAGWSRILIFILTIGLTASSLAVMKTEVWSIFQSSRVYTVFFNAASQDTVLDQSILSRFDELNDAWEHMTTTNSLVMYLFGFGHGASYPALTADKNPQNMDAEGRLHNIHFGPMLFFFRYGIVGLVAYTAFFLAVIVSFVRFCIKTIVEDLPTNMLVISGIALAYLLAGLMRNEFANPLFAFVVALFLTLKTDQGYGNS